MGARLLKALQAKVALADIAALPCKAWLSQMELKPELVEAFPPDLSLQCMGEAVLEAARRAHMQVLFHGEAGFPPGLEVLEDMPPVLFAWGETAPVEAPKLAMVGTRSLEEAFVPTARHFASRVAQAGILVVSGAAEGTDQVCLQAAMEASGRAWAFVGCGLDYLAAAQQSFWESCMCRGGAYFSEYPPGVRASRFTYPRRNRLISASSDAVVVLRAPQKSGSLYTAAYALEQGRPLWVLPGELQSNNAQGCLQLLKQGGARLATGPEEIILSLGGEAPLPEEEAPRHPSLLWKGEQHNLFPPEGATRPPGGGGESTATAEGRHGLVSPLPEKGRRSRGPAAVEAPPPAAADALSAAEADALSAQARLVWGLLQGAALFEELLAACGMDSAGLSEALCELELLGKVAQRPGKRYERI